MMTEQAIREGLANGPYAWPGGYPLFWITSDGQPLSFEAVQDNLERCLAGDHGWRLEALAINWADASLYCDHTGERIPSAYVEED